MKMHTDMQILSNYTKELDSNIVLQTEQISPAQKSRFKQLQETGKEAEFYFIKNYQNISLFSAGILEDARLWGDGYDFQVQCDSSYYLAEIKGLRTTKGSIRLTQNEYFKAKEYQNDYVLVVISNLTNTPKLNYIENPTQQLSLTPHEQKFTQVNYYSDNLTW